MDEKNEQALENEKTIDITTIGRKTGEARRIEIWIHNVDGKIYITGTPSGKRNWYQNLIVNPNFTFHLKQSVITDLNAVAHPILDEDDRRAWFSRHLADSDRDVEAWVKGSPLVEVTYSD